MKQNSTTKGKLACIGMRLSRKSKSRQTNSFFGYFDLGNKITGAGFPVYKNKGAKLQRALINYFIDKNTEAGYKEVQVPILINEDSGMK